MMKKHVQRFLVDFCQALAINSTKKYQNEGGPRFKECFALLQKTTKPAINHNLLASAVVFNFLIGNMDAHGKNFSLLYKNQSHLELTPFYDLLCTLVYPSLSTKMAMKIGSQYEIDKVLPRHWEQLCLEVQYAYPTLKRLINKQGEAILQAAQIEKANLVQMQRDTSVIDKISKLIEKHITRVLKQFL